MKIVVNRCFGGFGISAEALIELFKARSKIIETSSLKKYFGKDWKSYKPTAKLYDAVIFKNKVLELKSSKKIRASHDLVDIVEKMGSASYGSFAELEIVDVPDDIDWIIESYDGMETVEEVHRTW